jgi:hypothetical protein
LEAPVPEFVPSSFLEPGECGFHLARAAVGADIRRK